MTLSLFVPALSWELAVIFAGQRITVGTRMPPS